MKNHFVKNINFSFKKLEGYIVCWKEKNQTFSHDIVLIVKDRKDNVMIESFNCDEDDGKEIIVNKEEIIGLQLFNPVEFVEYIKDNYSLTMKEMNQIKNGVKFRDLI